MSFGGHESRGRPSVAIVGGGLAGMAAAAALADAPVDVNLYEAKRMTGGRAGSFLDAESGAAVDYCQHVAMGCCTQFIHLMRWSGLENELARYSELTFVAEGFPQSTFRASRHLPPPMHLAPALSRLNYLDRDERRQIRRGLWRLMRMRPAARAESSSTETMGQWLRRNGQSESVVGKFWNTVIASALGDDVDVVAVAPARKVFVDGFLQFRGASEVLVPRQPLSILFGERLPRVLSQRGVAMHLGTRVRQCDVEDDGRFSLRMEPPSRIVADDLIMAVPWHALPRLLTGTRLAAAVDRLQDLETVPSSPISGIHLWVDREITPLPHAVIIGRLSQWLFRQPMQVPLATADEHYYQVVISAAHDLRGRSAADICAEVMEDLRGVFPSAGPVRCRRFRVITDRAAVFSVTPEFQRMRPPCVTRQSGLFLAGDWVQTGWPATMEGAILSGYQAAEAVSRRHGWQGEYVQQAPPPALLSRLLIRRGGMNGLVRL